MPSVPLSGMLLKFSTGNFFSEEAAMALVTGMFEIGVHGDRVLAQHFFVDVLRKYQCVGHAKAALGTESAGLACDMPPELLPVR